jgi:hypothetical protein
MDMHLRDLIEQDTLMLAEQITLKQSQGLPMPFQRLWATMMTFLIIQIVLDRVLKRPVEGFSTRVMVTGKRSLT